MPTPAHSTRIAALTLLFFITACSHGPKVETQVIEQPDGVIVVDTLQLEATEIGRAHV